MSVFLFTCLFYATANLLSLTIGYYHLLFADVRNSEMVGRINMIHKITNLAILRVVDVLRLLDSGRGA